MTLEQLACYLPYNLEFMTDKGRWVLDSLEKGGWTCVGRKAMYCEQINLQSIKPLLKPLSEAVTEEFAEYYSFQTPQECIKWIIDGYCPHHQFVELCKNLFDCFDAISKSEALDINTFNK